jgi:hypothetical protein
MEHLSEDEKTPEEFVVEWDLESFQVTGPKEDRERTEDIHIPTPELHPMDFIPPIQGIIEARVRSLRRRHMVPVAHQNPNIKIEAICCLDEQEQTPRVPNMLALTVFYGGFSEDDPSLPAFSEFYRMDDAKDWKRWLKKLRIFRATRVTNGLDPEALKFGGNYYFDEVSFMRLFRQEAERGLCLPPGTSILVRKQKLMLYHLQPNKYVEKREDGSLGPCLRFGCPELLQFISQSIDAYYEPLRQYGRRHLSIINLQGFGFSVNEPENPYNDLLINAPPMVRLVSMAYAQPWEPGCWVPPFGTPDDPCHMFLETIEATTGTILQPPRELRSLQELEDAKILVLEQNQRGLRHVLSNFDADYLVACLPLPQKEMLAGLCRAYQNDVRDYLDKNSSYKNFSRFPLALEEVVRDSERIVRALIELQQCTLEDGTEISQLPLEISVPGDLIEKRFLGGALKYEGRRAAKVKASKRPFRPDPSENACGLFLRVESAANESEELSRLLSDCKVASQHLPLFESGYADWKAQKVAHFQKRDMEKRLKWAREKMSRTIAQLPPYLKQAVPTYQDITVAFDAKRSLDLKLAWQLLGQQTPSTYFDWIETLVFIEDVYAIYGAFQHLKKEYEKCAQRFYRNHYAQLDWILYISWPERLDDDYDREKEVAKRKLNWENWKRRNP